MFPQRAHWSVDRGRQVRGPIEWKSREPQASEFRAFLLIDLRLQESVLILGDPYYEKWKEETRLDDCTGSRTKNHGAQENNRRENSEQVETLRRSHAAKSLQHRIVARHARLKGLFHFAANSAPPRAGLFISALVGPQFPPSPTRGSALTATDVRGPTCKLAIFFGRGGRALTSNAILKKLPSSNLS